MTSIAQLKENFEQKSRDCKNYKRANFIFDLSDADTTYLKLLIARNEAELEYREAAGQNHLVPIITKQLEHYQRQLGVW